MAQRFKNQKAVFRVTIMGIPCIFSPMQLWREDRFLPLNPVVKGSTLGWHIKGKFFSYNQIKKEVRMKK